ncbi:MAG: biotin/lipoyl-binding protein [Rhodanobacter sp.]|jgi:membrane fusion protein
MSEGLFREEVLLSQRGEWPGSIRLQAPRLGWAFFGIGLLAVVIILALLLEGHYTRHEQVAGTLVPSSGLLTVTPTASGIVTSVSVREGEVVHAGQSLVEISGEQASASLGDTDAAIAAQLQIKRNHLQADLGDQQRLADLQAQDLHSRLSLLHGQIVQMKQQVALQRQRADSAMKLYDQWAKVSKTGVVSKL